MKIHISSRPTSFAGYALLLVLMFLAISLIGFGSLMFWIASSTKVTERNNLHVASQAAAESATEKVIAKMLHDFHYGTLALPSSYESLVPDTTGWPVQFSFKNLDGVANQTSVQLGSSTWAKLPSQFTGLYGFGQKCIVSSTATTKGALYAVPSTVSQTIMFENIPLFQFAIFYNQECEINPGAAMTVNGRVHSNFNIYATGSSSGSPLTFNDSVDAVGFVKAQPSPQDPQNYGHRNGNTVYGDTNSPVSNADSLTLPIGADNNNNPTNVTSILNLPPNGMMAPQPGAYSTNGQTYLFNAADLIVSNGPSGIDGNSSADALTVYYQNPNLVNPLVKVTPDIQDVHTVASNSYAISTGYVTNWIPHTTYTTEYVPYTTGHGRHQRTYYVAQQVSHTTYTQDVVEQTITNVTTSYVSVTNFYYSYLTNQTFYDYREGKTVQAVQVNVASLNAWLTNTSAAGGHQYDQQNTTGSTSKGHEINSIYVYNSAANDNSSLPGVRLVNGQQLPPDGLTVATPFPLYVKGDYNITTDGSHYSKSLGDTTYTRPAALLGDAITILSQNWQDSYGSSLGVGSRNPVNTTINAATLEGIVPSNGSHYSGGVENFLRLLENWSGNTLTYNGSIVVMFPSQYATTPWSYGSYYTAPTRDWGFDPNFQDHDKLPPLTPQVTYTVRADYASK